ncbi:hypothetical protein LZ31DRAFT_294484 [Colletotrichum somersetense]|nr:hypothetical protein LZ31DRAFT_294484 [Colletotrichum somersetense]
MYPACRLGAKPRLPINLCFESLGLVPKQQSLYYQVEDVAGVSHSPFLRIETQRPRNLLRYSFWIVRVVKCDVPHPIDYLIAL